MYLKRVFTETIRIGIILNPMGSVVLKLVTDRIFVPSAVLNEIAKKEYDSNLHNINYL